MFEFENLDSEYVLKILEFIDNKKKDPSVSDLFVNTLIRDDIFNLLDNYSIVIYYPNDDKSNNGFHLNHVLQGKERNFVYINTSKEKEKQIFTAAHELGHIWKIDEYCGVKDNAKLSERIINRFASELLMPSSEFISYFNTLLSSVQQRANGIDLYDFIKIITALMDYFFTSYKSIVHRFFEIEILDSNACDVLLGNNTILFKDIINKSKQYADEYGYSRLYYIDKRKYVNNLKKMLDNSKLKGELNAEWLHEFYSKFDLEDNFDNNSKINVKLSIPKGKDNNE